MFKHINTIFLITVLIPVAGSLWTQDTSKLPKPPAVEVVRAKIGTGPDDFCPSSSMGPMSFVISKTGEFYILDQENSRIQVFKDNKRIKMIPIGIPRSYSMDIDLLPGKEIILMDNSLQKMVFIIDESGKKVKEFKIAGGGIPDPSTVDGVYVVKNDQEMDGIWLDNSLTSVRLAGLDGNPDPLRAEVWGRFTHINNVQMFAAVAGDFTAEVDTSDLGISASEYKEYPIAFDTYLQTIVGLDADENNNIYMATIHWEGERGNISDEKNIVTVIGRGGGIEKQFEIFFPKHSEMIFRPFRVSPDGKVYFMAIDDKGLCIRMYDPWGN